MAFRRITKAQAVKRFNKGESIYLCPNRLRPDGPFSSACLIFSKEYFEKAEGYRDNPKLWDETVEKTAWNLMYNNWAYYNINGDEAGHCAHYYIEV